MDIEERVRKLEEAFNRHIKNQSLNSQWVNAFRASGIVFMLFFGMAVAGLQVRTEFYSFKVPLTEILTALSAPAFASGVAALVLVFRGKKEQ